jgi:hypothetical protein
MKFRNIAFPDGGDHSISNCEIHTAGTSAIRIESAGGIKIVNTKIVGVCVNGIDLAVGNNVGTSDLLISNCSIESFTGAGIKGRTGATSSLWGNIIITGNQFLGASGTCSAIDFSGTNVNDFTGVVIVGNFAAEASSSSPMISLVNCSKVVLAGNSGYTFASIISIGSGVTFATRSQTIPSGGTTGQSLKKLSNADYDVGWA